MNTPYRLHYAPDNASLIIRLALEEMGLAFETTLVDRQTRQQKSPAYLRLNPNGLIPVLETPDGALFETGAIVLWLADRHARMAPPLASAHRGAFLKWLFFVSNTLHADLRMNFCPQQYVGPKSDAQAALRANVQARLARHLAVLDALAGEAPGWLNPDEPTVIQYYIACLIRWMALYPSGTDRRWFRLGDTKHLQRLLQTLEQRPAVLKAARAEGLGPTPFTAPRYATPSEGSPT